MTGPTALALRALTVLLASLGAICLVVSSAVAHAYIMATAPAANATVATARSVGITFDEPITIESPNALTVRVTNGPNVPCAGEARLDPEDETRLVCSFSEPLPQGAYTVAWRVTSADTHVVHGTFSFGVGVMPGAATPEATSLYDPSSILAAIARWCTLAGVAMVVGALAFDVAVLRGGSFPGDQSAALATLRRSCRTISRVGIALAIAGGLLAIDVQTAAAMGSNALKAIPRFWDVATASPWGYAWGVRVGCLLAIAATTELGAPAPLSLALGAPLTLTLSLAGHALVSGTAAASTLPVVADWAHVVGASVWAGGLVVFATGIRPALASLAAGARAGFVRRIIARFTVTAIAAVTAIVVTGIYASVVHVGSFSALVGSTYGRIVLAKICSSRRCSGSGTVTIGKGARRPHGSTLRRRSPSKQRPSSSSSACPRF